MPGESYTGDLPPLTEDQRLLMERLRSHVETLAGEIGERNLGRYPRHLDQAADYVEDEFADAGYSVREQVFEVRGDSVRNVYVKRPGREKDLPRVVVGAHYDSVEGSPGANDNATGVAAVIELARYFHGTRGDLPLTFVAFVNEEPPYFTTEEMGSARFARKLDREGVEVRTMVSLETIGYYSRREGSQNYPFPFNYFYPSRGDFLGFVGNVWYRGAVRSGIEAFRSNAKFPSEGVAAPGFVPGISWSDHRSFWQYGYPAFMVTDTALYRYPHYHRATDRPGEVDYENLARVTDGLRGMINELRDSD